MAILAAASLAAVLSAPSSAAPAKTDAPPVALVLVDEASEKALGWPLPPKALAEGLERIEAAKPAAVVLKYFLEPAADDPRLAALFAKHRNVYLQCAGVEEGESPDKDLLAPFRVGAGGKADFDDRPKVLFPPKALAKAAAGVGFVHVKLNPSTNAAERWQVVSMAGGERYASLPLLLAARAAKVKPGEFFLKPAGQGWFLAGGKLHWMLDHEGALPIGFSAPGKGHPRHSFAEAKAGKIPAAALAGKIVVIGPDLPKRADNGIKTPVAPAHPKVELFADALATLLKR